VAVAMIGVMVPSVFAEDHFFEEQLDDAAKAILAIRANSTPDAPYGHYFAPPNFEKIIDQSLFDVLILDEKIDDCLGNPQDIDTGSLEYVNCFWDSFIFIENKLHPIRVELLEKYVLEIKTQIQSSNLSEDEQLEELINLSRASTRWSADYFEGQHKQFIEKIQSDRTMSIELTLNMIEKEKRNKKIVEESLITEKINLKSEEIQKENFEKALKSNPDVLPKTGSHPIEMYLNEKKFRDWYSENIPEYPNICDWYTAEPELNNECNEKLKNINSEEKPSSGNLGIASFVDSSKDPQHYIDRYTNEPAYKEWFGENYSQYSSIYEAVGLTEPISEQINKPEYVPEPGYTPEPVMEQEVNCGPGTKSVNGICQSIKIEEKSSEEGGGCLIATATYGSEMSQQVQQLRELRDNQLLQTESGTAFMGTFNDIYYLFSPMIADYERENPYFKEAVKIAITPMISSLSLMENAESESEVLSIGISVIALNLGMYLGVPAIAIVGLRRII
jgi:hypothetical protein